MEDDRRHFLVTLTKLIGSLGVTAFFFPFLKSWQPIGRPAPTQTKVDLRPLVPGESLIAVWNNQPIWIIRRTQAMCDTLFSIRQQLVDPDSLTAQQPRYIQKNYRSLNPEYFVVIALCTHLGCATQYKPQRGEVKKNWLGGFFCPCHGSMFDLAGRVMKNVPASTNLKIPPYHFTNPYTLVIGQDPEFI
jgi:ubiquinol-cytochrome c reductase iron-sulfur subunit